MIDGIDGARSGYRDQLANAFQNSEKTDSTESAEKPSQKWDAVFTDKKGNSVSVNDFLNLMVAQLRNQDFMNPVDDTQYVTQLAQFATMQQMQEMATYMKTNYVMSLVGKNVTAAKLSVSGELHKETGAVEKISLVNNEYAVYVNGKRFTLEQIMEINGSSEEQYMLSLIGKEVTIRQYDEDGEPAGELTGKVERVSSEDGKCRVKVDGTWYPMDDVLEVGGETPPKDDGTVPPSGETSDGLRE